MRKKSIVAVFLIIALLLGVVAVLASGNSDGVMPAAANSGISVVFNGEALTFPDNQPSIVDGVVMMPASAFEQLGFEVNAWEMFVHENMHVAGERLDLEHGATLDAVWLRIDYVAMHLYSGVGTATLDHWAYVTLCGAVALDFADYWSGENHTMGFGWRIPELDNAPVIIINDVSGRELIVGEDGFFRIPRQVRELLLPVRSVIQPAGFGFHFDEATQTVTLTRGANPELDENSGMMTLFELANANWTSLNLYWNPELRRLEARGNQQ